MFVTARLFCDPKIRPPTKLTSGPKHGRRENGKHLMTSLTVGRCTSQARMKQSLTSERRQRHAGEGSRGQRPGHSDRDLDA